MPAQKAAAQPIAADRMDRSGIKPAFGGGLPAGTNGSAIVRDPKYGRAPGVYPVHVFGTYVLDPANPLTAPLNLCYIPHGCILSNFLIITSGVTGTLQDSLPTPTVYCTLAGPIVTPANMTAAQAQNWGTMYAQTPRAIGPEGCQVVQWSQRTLLQIAGAAGAPATPFIYMVQFSPVYDSGV